jgi:excisionase family DNA binding protein
LATRNPFFTDQTRLDPIKLACNTADAAALELSMEDRWLSVDEIAEYLGVAKDTIYTWVTSKGMPGHKVGRFWKFKKEDVDAWVREGGAAASSDDFENKEPRNA